MTTDDQLPPNPPSSQKTPLHERSWYVLIKDIGMPIVCGLTGTIFTILFTFTQCSINDIKKDFDDAAKDIDTKEQVLTDFGKTISELLIKNDLKENKNAQNNNENLKDILRGHTLIALRRLDPQDNNNEAESGKLKGILIRYLYELKQLGFVELNKPEVIKPKIIDLSGANIDYVVLEDAWLPNIDLTGAWLRHGNFKNADLTNANLMDTDLTNTNFINANLTNANLTNANLTNADLRFANLKTAKNIKSAKFKNTCYVQGTETKYFPDDFKPQAPEMKPIPENKSDPNKPEFVKCKDFNPSTQ